MPDNTSTLSTPPMDSVGDALEQTPLTPDLPIIFEDEHLIAIHKPAKLLVHRSPIDKRETQFAVQILRDQLNGQWVSPVHRLDKPTSGLLLFAKHPEANAKLQALFLEHAIEKEYLAIVRGFAPAACEIDHPVKVKLDKRDKKTQQPPKDAQTTLNTLAQARFDHAVDERYPESRYSLVKLNPKTGRRHQLRYHTKHLHHPIIGDAKYGRSEHNRFFEANTQQSRLYLCATKLSFTHPYTEQQTMLYAHPQQSFLNACDFCQFDKAIAQYQLDAQPPQKQSIIEGLS